MEGPSRLGDGLITHTNVIHDRCGARQIAVRRPAEWSDGC